MKTLISPIFRRIGSVLGGALLAAGMTQTDANLVVNASVALALFGMDIALSKLNFMRSK